MRLPTRRIEPGVTVADRELDTVAGPRIPIPVPGQTVHLQFRRFAGCPVCNLHLRSIARRHDEIEAAGIREVAVFHADPEELRPHVAELPFAVVADPGKRLYREFGVEASARSVLHPRAWPTIVRSVAITLVDLVRGRAHLPALRPTGGRLGLPADFLIASDGRVLAAKYGTHADDQWSVDELLAHARDAASAPVAAAALSG